MNILIVHHFADLGGAERSLLEVVHFLNRQENVHVHLFAPAGKLSAQLPEGVCFKVMAFRPSSRNPLKQMLLLGVLLRHALATLLYCRRRKINRLYLGSLKALVVALPSRLVLRIPLVYHLRDSVHSRLLPRLLRLVASRVISVSEFINHQIMKYIPLDKRRVIYNGIPAGEIRIRTNPTVETLGYAGQLVPWKRVEMLVQALKMLRENFPSLRLRIAGQAHFEKDKIYEQQLREICAGDENISFTGWRDDIQTFLREIDLLVLPSRNEPFGRVLVEAMLAGVPVIGVNSGAIPEIIDDGTNGLVCQDTPEQLSEAMERMILDRELGHRCIENGRIVVQTRFSAERYGREVYECLRDAL